MIRKGLVVGGVFGCLGVGAAIIFVIVALATGIIALLEGPGPARVVDMGVKGRETATAAAGAGYPATPDVLNLPMGATARVGDVEVTAISWRTSAGGESLKPDTGNVWIIVDVSVRNKGSDPYSLSSTGLFANTSLTDPSGREYSASGLQPQSSDEPDTPWHLDGSIPAGDILRGEVGFEVPQSATRLQFKFIEGFFFAFRAPQVARWNLQ